MNIKHIGTGSMPARENTERQAMKRFGADPAVKASFRISCRSAAGGIRR